MKNTSGQNLEGKLNDGTHETDRNQRDRKGNDDMEINPNNYDLSSAAHPITCVFTFAFKASAFVA